MMKRSPLIICSLSLFGCGGGSDGTGPSTQPPPVTKPAVASVSVTVPKANLIVGEKVQASATVKDGTGAVLTDRTVAWSSSSAAIAIVAADGMVTSVGPGTATITATVEEKSGSVGLTIAAISNAAVASIRLNYAQALIAKGQPLLVVATALDASGNELTGKPISWTTSDSAVIVVDASGTVTGAGPGSATLTAQSEGKSTTATFSVITFTAIQPGPRNTCAIATGGQLYCAGADYGSLAKPAAAGLHFVSLSSGGEPPTSDRVHTCGITTDGDAYCWGANNGGELGTGDFQTSVTPRPVAGGLKFKQITTGRYHTCGLTISGPTYCWGEGTRGQMGNGTVTGSPVPVPINGNNIFTMITAGKDHTCGITSTSTYCWGSNNLGEAGNGTADDYRAFPDLVDTNIAFKTISSKVNATCGLDLDGAAYCWGDNTILELGSFATVACDGGKPCARKPVPVVTSLRFATISASQFATCAVTAALQAYCWGGNQQQVFGSPAPPTDCGTPGFSYGCTIQPTPGPQGFSAITGSHRNYCGIRNDNGVAYCWGGNDLGQLGFPGVSATNVPKPFSIDPASS